MYTHDYIIVGLGLAGSSIVQRLSEKEKSYVVFNQHDANQASRIASGIWNPVTLKRMKKSWLADEMLAEISPFYKEAEKQFGGEIIDDLTVLSLFTNPQQSNEWVALCDNLRFEKILNHQTLSKINQNVISKHGLGEVKQSGRIKTELWLDAVTNWLKHNEFLRECNFDHSRMIVSDSSVEYEGIKARGIIFCEGLFAASQNPFFSYIPFKLTKGEVIEIECANLELQNTINSGVFISPLGGNRFKVGATYDWDNINTIPTKSAKEELLQKLRKFISADFKVVSQKAGIRPTIKDRRPLLGTHPQQPLIHIYNGMGSRGVFMTPYLSKAFAEFLFDNKPLHPEADIKRFDKLIDSIS